MEYIILSIIASFFVIIGYIPEINNILKTKQATIRKSIYLVYLVL